jgi:S1-C subfamily serine protease
MEGSGVIIDASGDIVTNEHVVGPANASGTKILVTLNDGTGRKLPGTIIGADHTSDVALVHIDAPNLPVAHLGSSQGLVPGQMAVAIGNPLGFRFTVTHGVVSALGRPINDEQEGRVYENLIQTDCAINPGNSGGALVNLEGQVIGINTIVASRAQGIGFAIPIDTALRVADELKRFGKVKRPWLGLLVITNTNQLASAYDLPNVAGVVVARITRDGPGAGAGLQRGDVITRINDQPVRSEEDFKSIEKKLKIGQTVAITLRRGDQAGKGSITVGDAP